jgi:1,2-dihydroxy-3-keto-5-methylthiopentene dioxygenase
MSLSKILTRAQGDQREPHDSGREVSPEYLSKLGILHFHYPDLEDVNALASERQYKNRDEVTISPQAMGDVYEEKVKMFFHEHLHEDEEIRYILDGGGFFDVRSEGDDWVRIKLEKHDLMIMPPGIYHRFTTDTQNVSSCLRQSPLGRVLIINLVHEGYAAVQRRSQMDSTKPRRRDG